MQHDDDPEADVIPISRAKRKHQARASERTELEISEMLVQRFGGELRYCSHLGGWFAWTGTHWQLDEREHARECAKEIARELAAEAAALLDDDVFKAAKRAGSARGVAAILDLARSAPGIVFSPDDADRDPWLLNCANGTLDLRTGTVRPHDRAELITRVCPVAYDPNATAPRFQKFNSHLRLGKIAGMNIAIEAIEAGLTVADVDDAYARAAAAVGNARSSGPKLVHYELAPISQKEG